MDALSATFAALADPTRRAILAQLARGDTHVGDLARPFDISGPAISRHLRVLESAGLIERKVDAQWRICRLRGDGLRVAHDWLWHYRQFWDESLEQLADYIEREQREAAAAPASIRQRAARPKASKSPRRKTP
jgi:DNA-binding transcriptional ArsR family regulator